MTNRDSTTTALPHTRIIVPESDGTYRGEILEFPGCLVTGESPGDTYVALESAAHSWVESAEANGQTVPPPVDTSAFSGRLVLRLPRSLHKRASLLAERDGASLNQFIATALAIYIGENQR